MRPVERMDQAGMMKVQYEDGQTEWIPIQDYEAIEPTFSYQDSPDGQNENLLILCHGLGDSDRPFHQLARQMRLPQTATLALRGPVEVPFGLGFAWYESFDLQTGEVIPPMVASDRRTRSYVVCNTRLPPFETLCL